MDPYYTLDNIPDAEKNPDFWRIVQSPEFKHTVNFLILNEIRKFDPASLTNDSTRSQLAKLKAWQELLDLPDALLNKDKEAPPSDELEY